MATVAGVPKAKRWPAPRHRAGFHGQQPRGADLCGGWQFAARSELPFTGGLDDVLDLAAEQLAGPAFEGQLDVLPRLDVHQFLDWKGSDDECFGGVDERAGRGCRSRIHHAAFANLPIGYKSIGRGRHRTLAEIECGRSQLGLGGRDRVRDRLDGHLGLHHAGRGLLEAGPRAA